MGKGKSIFRFKKFDCSHGAGSMKIGVDAVLLGAWVDVSGAERILDVGTGCGVIALMCAQRNDSALIDAIDIDAPSVAEATQNFATSPWYPRLQASQKDFTTLNFNISAYDLILSNPPYFHSGIDSPDTPRLTARHAAILSPETLLTHGVSLLTPNGSIAMVVPADQLSTLTTLATSLGLTLTRALKIQGHPTAPIKRILLQFSLNSTSPEITTIPTLTLETVPGTPTPAHRALCHDFYLKY